MRGPGQDPRPAIVDTVRAQAEGREASQVRRGRQGPGGTHAQAIVGQGQEGEGPQVGRGGQRFHTRVADPAGRNPGGLQAGRQLFRLRHHVAQEPQAQLPEARIVDVHAELAQQDVRRLRAAG